MVSPFGRGFESLQLHLNKKERTFKLFALFLLVYQICCDLYYQIYLLVVEICLFKRVLTATVKTMCADHVLW